MSESNIEELKSRIAELEKEIISNKGNRLSFKVSEKGGVSVYGLGKFPVTLYYEQWVRLLEAASRLQVFLDENKDNLKMKVDRK